MPDNIDRDNNQLSFLEWLDKGKEPTSNSEEPTPRQTDETVSPHTPARLPSKWAYTLREGGVKYPVSLPVTEAQVLKIKIELQNSANWKYYQISPYGGPRAYTLVLSFPPFDPLRVAEVFLPTGEVWRSTTRQFHKL